MTTNQSLLERRSSNDIHASSTHPRTNDDATPGIRCRDRRRSCRLRTCKRRALHHRRLCKAVSRDGHHHR
jgi:hypothetical protein